MPPIERKLIDAIIAEQKEEMKDLYLADVEKSQIDSDLDFNALFSYALQKKDVDIYKDKIRGKLFVDSGAFSAWTKGKEINVDEYINWINERAEFIDLYGQVDTIPGTMSQGLSVKAFEESARKTWENFLYMYPKMKHPERMLYTYHTGEPLSYLKQALEWKDENGKQLEYIALGGVVGNPKNVRRQFFKTCYDVIKQSSNPNVKVHAFGMTDFDLLEQFPVTSSDSTSWIMVGAMGNIMSDYGNLILSERQKFSKNHYSNLTENELKVVMEQVKKFGFTLEQLAESRDHRIMYNAMYMMDRVSKLKVKEYKTYNRKLF